MSKMIELTTYYQTNGRFYCLGDYKHPKEPGKKLGLNAKWYFPLISSSDTSVKVFKSWNVKGPFTIFIFTPYEKYIIPLDILIYTWYVLGPAIRSPTKETSFFHS